MNCVGVVFKLEIDIEGNRLNSDLKLEVAECRVAQNGCTV